MTTTRDRTTTLTQTQSVYQALRDAILGVELRPGEAISERWLEGRLAASRTPVRSALVRLEGEGLVQRQGRGYIVTPIDIGEIEQAYVFRETIEMTVVRLAAARADALDLSGIEPLILPEVRDTSSDEWFDIGIAFHVELARLSGNAFFVRAIDDVMTRIARGRWLEIWSTGGRERAFMEHERIVELVTGGAGDEAAQAVQAHVRHGRDRLLDALKTQRRGFAVRGFAVLDGPEVA
ncbi:GntR family transcriptional regulator [Tistrella bauzanensis]|uniref:GntR family transcriptional regulator n=1 Tax=Tistrella arctica TaxID=3133430 RepID=A0ABU9YS58_9PROT